MVPNKFLIKCIFGAVEEKALFWSKECKSIFTWCGLLFSLLRSTDSRGAAVQACSPMGTTHGELGPSSCAPWGLTGVLHRSVCLLMWCAVVQEMLQILPENTQNPFSGFFVSEWAIWGRQRSGCAGVGVRSRHPLAGDAVVGILWTLGSCPAQLVNGQRPFWSSALLGFLQYFTNFTVLFYDKREYCIFLRLQFHIKLYSSMWWMLNNCRKTFK